MAVAAQAQQLQVGVAQGADQLVIPGALGVGVGGQTVGHMGLGNVDIDVVEEVGLHEVTVALVMRRGQPLVLVQIHGLDFLEAEVALLVPDSQLLVGTHGGGTGGQAQHAVGLADDLGGNEVGGPAAHGRVIRLLIDPHNH